MNKQRSDTLSQEKTMFWSNPMFNNIELLQATYITHTFAPHMHEDYAIGVIDAGANRFRYRGSTYIAPQGSIVIIHPSEMHTGAAQLEEGLTYRMLYPAASLLQQARKAIIDRSDSELPFFSSPVIYDSALAQLISHLHTTLTTPSNTLEHESNLLGTLTQLIMRHAQTRPLPVMIKPERTKIQQVRTYLEDHATENVTLEQLSSVANMSPFHLLRVFRSVVGLPPHSYLTNIRISQAKLLIAAGMPLTAVAGTVGFADQSHLTKQFKSLIGVTPGQYARSYAFQQSEKRARTYKTLRTQ
jgi:AraC-like DNA-binding protein